MIDMKIRENPDLHFTYCLNIHPGERLQDVVASINTHAAKVKSCVSPQSEFGLGLRLGAKAVEDISREGVEQLKDVVRRNGMYVFTVNGFPYGGFHGGRVKEDVYAPDWRDERRVTYTSSLVSILAELLPEGVDGSISTVPVAYADWVKGEDDVQLALRMLMKTVKHCVDVERETGKSVMIALEPEPDCYLQRTDDVVQFFSRYVFAKGPALLARMCDMSIREAEQAVRRYLGICFDTCHSAVQFEDPVDSVRRIASEGIGIYKVQISSAVRAVVSGGVRRKLAGFIDPVYLHQTRVRGKDGFVCSYPDLDEKVIAGMKDGEEVRTHFHVPLWLEEVEGLGGTAGSLSVEFFQLLGSGITEHIEAETYTFGILPESMAGLDVADNLVRELDWVQQRLQGLVFPA